MLVVCVCTHLYLCAFTLSQLFSYAFLFLPHFLLLLLDPPLLCCYRLQVICTNRTHLKYVTAATENTRCRSVIFSYVRKSPT